MEAEVGFFDSDLSFVEHDSPADGSSFAPSPPTDQHVNNWLRVGSRQVQEQLDKRLRVAAACGFEEVVQQLLDKGANPNAHDSFTGWTCLHWAASLRRVRMMSLLDSRGASFLEVDHHKATPLDFLSEEVSSYRSSALDSEPKSKDSKKKKYQEVRKVLFTWGDPSNYTLGRESSSKSTVDVPRVVNFPFASDDVFITDVSLAQYHALALASNFSVWSWGIGEGGRLGYPADIQTIPKRVKELSHEDIIQIATSTTMSACVSRSGKLYLFGKTDHGQFGEGNRKQKLDHPTAVQVLKKYRIKAASLSNVHVAALTDEGTLWTWGTQFLPQLLSLEIANCFLDKSILIGKGDAGQLGHGTFEEELVPRLVALTNCKIVSVVCKDSLTALYNEKNDLYWFGLGQAKPTRIKFSFGYPSLHRAGSFKLISMCCSETCIFFLVDEGALGRKVYSFRPLQDAVPVVLNEFSLASEGVQLEVAQGNLYLVTRIGATWRVPLSSLTLKSSAPTATFDSPSSSKSDRSFDSLALPFRSGSPSQKSAYLSSSPPIPLGKHVPPSEFAKSSSAPSPTQSSSLETRICYEIRPTKFVASSHNFAAICDGPRAPLASVPVSSSSWKEDVEVMVRDPTKCDVVIVDPNSQRVILQAHSVFLSRSPTLLSALESPNLSRNSSDQVVIESKWGVNAKAWGVVWKYLLTDQLDLSEEDSAAPSAQSRATLQESVRELAQALKLTSLFTLVAYNRLLKPNESVKRTPSLSEHLRALVLSESGKLPLADIRIITAKEVEIMAHSGILLQRSEYFRTMLQAAWREAHLKTVHMEEASPEAIRALLVYLYSDELLPNLNANVQVELLLLADQLFLTRLKDMCAAWLMQNATPENAMQLLEIADLTQMQPLREGVIEYIAVNLELFLRSKMLRLLDAATVRAVEHFVAVHFLDAPYLHFTHKRQKYIEDFVMNLMANTPPPKGARPRHSSKGKEDPDAASSSLPNTPPLASPSETLLLDSAAPTTASEGETTPVSTPLSTSAGDIPLSTSNGGPLTPAQRRLKKSLDQVKPAQPSSPQQLPPSSPPKPAWGSVAPVTAPSLASIMTEETSKSQKPNVPPHISPNKATTTKSPAKAWGVAASSEVSPIKFEEIAQDQMREKSRASPTSKPIKIANSNSNKSKPSTDISPTSPTLESYLPSSSPSRGPVVHRHIWGAPTSLASTPPSQDATTFLSPTPKDAFTLLESQKYEKKTSKSPAAPSGPWSQHTPNLLTIMSEQYIEKIVKEEEELLKPTPPPSQTKNTSKAHQKKGNKAGPSGGSASHGSKSNAYQNSTPNPNQRHKANPTPQSKNKRQ